MKYLHLKTIFILVFLIFLNLNILSYAHNDCHCDCCLSHKGAFLPEEIVDGTVLTIQDCISIGLKNSPVIKRHKYELDLAKSNVGMAKSVFSPKFMAGVGYNQIHNTNKSEFYSLYRELPNVGVSLRQMIWDFGRSSANIKMEKFYKLGAEYEFMDSVCSAVFDIKTKYYSVLRAQSILAAKKVDYDVNNKIIDNVNNMIKNGSADKADLVTAQTEQFRIKNEIIVAEDVLKNAKEDLNNSMFFVNAPNYVLSETDTYNKKIIEKDNPYKFVSYNNQQKTLKIKTSKSAEEFIHPSFTYEEAVSLAYKNSPDLKVLEATKNAMEQALLSIKRSYYPELSAQASYGRFSTNHYNNNEFAIGVNLSSELNPMELKYGVSGARAQVNIASNEIEKYKEDLYFIVRKALNTANMSKERIPVAEAQLQSALQTFNLTFDRYRQNKMNQLELLHARNAYNDAMESYINSVYSYNLALIDLEIAMHYHLVDIHERTEHALKYHDDDIIDNFNNIMDCDKHDKK